MAYADTTASDVKRAYAASVSMAAATTWTISTYSYNAAVQYTGIALSGANGGICFQGGTGLRVLRTTDSFVGLTGIHATIDANSGAGQYARMRYFSSDGAFWISYNRNYVSGPSGSHQTKLARSADNGATWAFITPANSSFGPGAMSSASFAISGSCLYVTYGDYDGMVGGATILRQVKSADGGATW